jgi:hypothetical protein
MSYHNNYFDHFAGQPTSHQDVFGNTGCIYPPVATVATTPPDVQAMVIDSNNNGYEHTVVNDTT